MAEPLIIQLIADYGVGDPAFAEVIQKFTYLDKDIRIRATSVPAFSTIATGLWISQFATVNAFSGLIIYSNTAPRIAITEEQHNHLGGQLAYTTLEDGTIVIAVNVGYCFSFLKNKITKLHHVNVPNAGSQFRSRDYYPNVVVKIAHGDLSAVGEEISLSSIRDVPKNVIAFIDGYGNLKTTTRKSQCTIPIGTRVKISCNNTMLEGVVADEAYKVHDGEISFAPGSTGGDDRYMEIWVRGMSAWKTFGNPHIETEFTITPVA